MSRGSLSELETLVLLSRDLRLLSEADYGAVMEECEAIGSLLEGLSRKLKIGSVSDEDADYET